jgi:hypothetical protein
MILVDTRQDITPDDPQAWSNIYVGINVVPQHLEKFFQLAKVRQMLADGEEVLAIFDCMILDAKYQRLAGSTLHDYAILTNQYLILWARERDWERIIRIEWSYATLEKWVQRSSSEGSVAISYRSGPPVSSHKLVIRGKNKNVLPGHITSPSNRRSHQPTVIRYLDLMPLKDVPICLAMLRFLLANNFQPNCVEAFREAFQDELAGSKARLAANYPAPSSFDMMVNKYSRSRMERGMWLESSDIYRRLGRAAENTAMITELLGGLAENEQARSLVVGQLRKQLARRKAENGNDVLFNTFNTLIQPVLDLLAATGSNAKSTVVSHHIEVRANDHNLLSKPEDMAEEKLGA